MKAFILAAGIGSRLLPLTKNTPKALIKIQGTPMIELVIKRLINYGYDYVVINLHYLGKQIEDFCRSQNNFGIHIDFIYEEKLLDTGGSIKNAINYLQDKDPILLHNVDALSDIDFNTMRQFHVTNNADISLAVQNRKTDRYFLFGNSHRLIGWKNIETNEIILQHDIKGKISTYAFSGIHLIGQNVLEQISQHYDTVFSITKYYVHNCKSLNIYGFNHDNSFFMDLGKHENLKFANYLDLNNFV